MNFAPHADNEKVKYGLTEFFCRGSSMAARLIKLQEDIREISNLFWLAIMSQIRTVRNQPTALKYIRLTRSIM
jgi:hypothetical protein